MAEVIQNHQVFTLEEVLKSIQKTLSNRYQSAYWMKAEMNKLNFYAYSGHCYPDLVEKSGGKVVAQARAIIWNVDFQVINKKFKEVLQESLKDGINILFLAKITFSPDHGLSLQILDIDPSYSLGILEQEKQENIARLQKEGLFRKNKSLLFPLLPQRIAIISVASSKGYADFLKILNQNTSGYKFVQQLFPARLQGDLAVTDIIRQLQKIRKYAGLFDAVTIIRGGGGEVGLSAFNHYDLAKEIANFPLPVLTGIGHATNETISEMVAFGNAITPTECAQFLLDRFEQFDQTLQKFQQRLVHLTQFQVSKEKERLSFSFLSLEKSSRHMIQGREYLNQQTFLSLQKSSKTLFHKKKESFLLLKKNLENGCQHLIKKQKATLEQFSKNIELVSPLNILKRGFSITKIKGRSIHPEEKLPETGTELETILYQGTLTSTVVQKQKNQ